MSNAVKLRECGCSPTAYDGTGGPIVHSQLCEVAPEKPLSQDELRQWKAAMTAWESGHPSRLPPVRANPVISFPIPKTSFHTCAPGCGCRAHLGGDGIPFARRR